MNNKVLSAVMVTIILVLVGLIAVGVFWGAVRYGMKDEIEEKEILANIKQCQNTMNYSHTLKYDLVEDYNLTCEIIREMIMLEYVPFSQVKEIRVFNQTDPKNCQFSASGEMSFEYYGIDSYKDYYFKECIK